MKKFIITLILSFTLLPALACTSVIISGSRTRDGRPLMLKHRDTDDQYNGIRHFRGPLYSFIGLVNSDSPEDEAWTGTNTAGFSIMNTASYNIKDDTVPDSQMDREGHLMYLALGICKTLSDFETLLDTLPRPLGVEANFGVIDSHGGAAYYEVNNHSHVKYDVASSSEGYRVVTNFSSSGREKDRKGSERFLTASKVMAGLLLPSSGDERAEIRHSQLFRSLSRSYRHEVLGIDLSESLPPSGLAIDQDFIPRGITSASIVIEGVLPGENPARTIMWTIIGYPSCSVAIPLLASDDEDCVPSYMQPSGALSRSAMSEKAMTIKKAHVFNMEISSGPRYFDAAAILHGRDSLPALLDCCQRAEDSINSSFEALYSSWTTGAISHETFMEAYRQLSPAFFEAYLQNFAPYLQ